jgi:hypothetical protein
MYWYAAHFAWKEYWPGFTVGAVACDDPAVPRHCRPAAVIRCIPQLNMAVPTAKARGLFRDAIGEAAPAAFIRTVPGDCPACGSRRDFFASLQAAT